MRGLPESAMTDRRWLNVIANAVIAFVFGAAFPRLAYRLRWPTRLGPRGLVAYIACNTAISFALQAGVLPALKAKIKSGPRRSSANNLDASPRCPRCSNIWASTGRTSCASPRRCRVVLR